MRNLLSLPLSLEVLRRCPRHPRRQMPRDSNARMHQAVWTNRISEPFAIPDSHGMRNQQADGLNVTSRTRLCSSRAYTVQPSLLARMKEHGWNITVDLFASSLL